MPTKAVAKPPAQTPAHLARIDARGSVLIKPLRPLVESLDITTPEEYQEADALLGRVITKRKEWVADCEEILAPLRTAKQAADKVKAKYDKPLEALEVMVRAKMQDYKREEARQLAEAQRAADAATAKLTQQLEEAEETAQSARTAQMRERLAAKRDQLATAIEEVAAEVPEATTAAGSTTRTVTRWKLADMENGLETVLRGVLAGKIPAAAITLNEVYINRKMTEPETVASWPGFEVYEDVVIVRR